MNITENRKTELRKFFKLFSRLSLILFLISTSSCHVGRYFVWNFADIRDHEKFPADTIKTGDYKFSFAEVPNNFKLSIPEKYNNTEDDFEQFLKKNKTLALIVIKNDTILYENYFSDYYKGKIHPTFSVAKVFVSALTGIAIDEGYIQNINQPVTDFLKELTDTNFKKVSIADLLNMRSGIAFKESYMNPFGHIGKFYYGRNLRKYTYKLKVKEGPGARYEYQSANTQLVSLAIEKATQMPVSKYLEEKIWKPLGMEYYATWNYDSKKGKTIKAFCCLNAMGRDLAKFGRLYLNNGIWNGQQLISKEWIKKSNSVINNSIDSQGYHYSYAWRVCDTGESFAKGLLGQYVWISPLKNLIIIRLGSSYSGIDWADYFHQLSEQL